MKVELENLTKRWGNVVGADSMNLDIKDAEFVAFLGPSGCGKTTTLLMVAGIYKPTDGFIRFDGQVVNHVAPKDRNVGMVFQSYALYPHMTVFQNISYPLKLKKTPKEEMRKQAQQVADMMGIGHLMDRPGAGQRAGIAAVRRAAQQPGCPPASEHAQRNQTLADGTGHHLHLRHPRPGGGDDDGRPRCRDERWLAASLRFSR